MPKNELLTITSTQMYNSCRYWNKQGQLLEGPCFNQFSLAPYFEYGFFDQFTGVINPNFNYFNQGNQPYSVPFGFENIYFAGRYSLWKEDWKQLSFQLGYNAPIRTGLYGNTATPTNVYALITRQKYLDIRLMYGAGGYAMGSKTKTWYGDMEIAFQPNFTGGADETNIKFMLGLKTLEDRLIFELQEWNFITSDNPLNNSFPNYNVCTVMANVIYWFVPKIVGIQMGLQQDFYGTNIGQGTAPFMSVWWKFD